MRPLMRPPMMPTRPRPGLRPSDEKKAKQPGTNEPGDEIVNNLLDQNRISTPNPNKTKNTWKEWTCLHCDVTMY